MGLDEATRFAGGLTTFWCLGSANDLPVGLDGAAVFSGVLDGEDGLPYLLVGLEEVGDPVQVLEDDDHDHVQVLEDNDQVSELLRWL